MTRRFGVVLVVLVAAVAACGKSGPVDATIEDVAFAMTNRGKVGELTVSVEVKTEAGMRVATPEGTTATSGSDGVARVEWKISGPDLLKVSGGGPTAIVVNVSDQDGSRSGQATTSVSMPPRWELSSITRDYKCTAGGKMHLDGMVAFLTEFTPGTVITHGANSATVDDKGAAQLTLDVAGMIEGDPTIHESLNDKSDPGYHPILHLTVKAGDLDYALDLNTYNDHLGAAVAAWIGSNLNGKPVDLGDGKHDATLLVWEDSRLPALDRDISALGDIGRIAFAKNQEVDLGSCGAYAGARGHVANIHAVRMDAAITLHDVRTGKQVATGVVTAKPPACRGSAGLGTQRFVGMAQAKEVLSWAAAQ